ncbi:hypothetical protein AVEN_113046-1, partial [Araneus ventricosus]
MVKRIPGCEACEEDKLVATDDSEEITDQEILETVLKSNAILIEEPEVGVAENRVSADGGFRAKE